MTNDNNNNDDENSYVTDTTTFNATIQNLDKFNFAGMGDKNTGHGFAAEDYNTVHDNTHFKNAKVVGGDNALNGADRLVSGVEIQTKYYTTGKRSINATFDNKGDGMYRYWDKNGHPMQVEVPRDQYDKAIETMQNKIKDGKVKGITDPSQAKDLVRKGNLTYKQAKNVAKAGNIDSLKFDAQAGVVTATYAGGIAFAVNLSMCLINGQKIEEAIENSIVAMAKSSAIAFGSHIAISQISKYVSSNITRKGIKATLQTYVKPLLQKAGMNYGWTGTMAKKTVLKSVNTGVLALLLAIPDLYSGFISNTISKSQMIKNLGVLGAGFGGGSALIGIAGVSAVSIPGFGLLIAGGIGASIGAKKLLDLFIHDDIEKMKPYFTKATNQVAEDYMLTEHEIELFSVDVAHLFNDSSFWKKCHKSSKDASNKGEAYYEFMYDSLDICAENIVKTRPPIKLENMLHNANVFNSAFTEVNEVQSSFKSQEEERTQALSNMNQSTNETQSLLDDF